jgi:hypothetical protein
VNYINTSILTPILTPIFAEKKLANSESRKMQQKYAFYIQKIFKTAKKTPKI